MGEQQVRTTEEGVPPSFGTQRTTGLPSPEQVAAYIAHASEQVSSVEGVEYTLLQLSGQSLLWCRRQKRQSESVLATT